MAYLIGVAGFKRSLWLVASRWPRMACLIFSMAT
jgi:hypothetical protein